MLEFLWHFIIRCIEQFFLYHPPHHQTYYNNTVQKTILPSGREVAHTICYQGSWLNEIPSGKPIVLYYHGNGMCLYDCSIAHHDLFKQIDAVFVTVEYANYVRGGGSVPFEHATQTEQLLAETVEFCEYICLQHADAPLFLMGHSLGTGVAIHLASSPSLASVLHGIILISPYLSIISVMSIPLATWMPFIDVLCSYKRVSNVKCPMISFVGTNDGLIAPSHSIKLFELQKREGNTILLRGAGHNTTMQPNRLPILIPKISSFIQTCID